jgi:AraC-like DNA-binding protein
MGRADGAHAIAEIAAAQEEASARPELLEALQQHLGLNLRTLSVASVARALGVSPRTLQHYLRRAGTSFRREVNAARVRAAQQILEAGETKLTSVALDVGCASSQHFSTLFRKQTGFAPSEWRARQRVHRPAPADK